MAIIDLLKPQGIRLNASLADKGQAIDLLVKLHQSCGNLKDKELYKKDILAREQMGTTAVGNGIAVPHAKSAGVLRAGLCAVTVKGGVDYSAPDGKNSDIIFMIAAPDGQTDEHLEMLSRLMTMLMDDEFCNKLRSAKTPDEFLKYISEQEKLKYPENDESAAPKTSGGYNILAVTACPTGIAHTYMAAEALEKAGAKMGIRLKAETQGSGGAKNVLTKDEIANCEGIIIAADKDVDLSRFSGKPVLRVPVSDGINKPEELIERIRSGSIAVYHGNGSDADQSDSGSESFGRRTYKQLMNGVSHMLPFVIGGGIMIALAFLFDSGAVNDSNYADFGTITPLASFFKNIGNTAFGFMLPILAGYIAMSIADRPGLAIGFVGGAIAVSGATFTSPAGTDVSAGFLGALVAGFAGGYLMLGMRKVCDKLPKALEGIKPILIYPLFGIILIAVVMCAINPFVGWLNTAIFNGLSSMGEVSKVLLGVVLAGMMAIDMGGPFNKAAYVFGTATLTAAAGASDIMAAVMIGGMVPPIAIALATTFFKDRFTKDERKAGPVNYIMGLCFITEGAIPFAASDPLRVLPSCIVGSAVAGGLSMFFGCALPAPHGGVFVFPVMQNALWYCLALVIGSVVGMLMLRLLKKKVEVR